MATLKHNTTNDHRFDDMMKDIRELGRESAMGKDALPKLAVRTVAAAAAGVIDTEKDKHDLGDGNKCDDAALIYTEYLKAENKKLVYGQSSNSRKAQISKVRQLVQMGGMTTCDPELVLQRTIEISKAQAAAGGKVKSMFAAMVDVARAQIAQDSDLTDAQIEAIVAKPEPRERTLITELEAIRKKLEKIMSGEGDFPADQSEEIIIAHEKISERLAYWVQAEKVRKVQEQAAELGLDLSGLLAAAE